MSCLCDVTPPDNVQGVAGGLAEQPRHGAAAEPLHGRGQHQAGVRARAAPPHRPAFQ